MSTRHGRHCGGVQVKTLTRFADINKPECEARTWGCTPARDQNGRGKIYFSIACPFCGAMVTTYLWSLCGSGKRCHCGAIFGASATAYKLRDTKEPS